MQVTQTICGMCSNDTCAIDVYVEDGRIVKVRGSKGGPVSQGRLCIQAQGAVDLISDSNRLQYPLRRVGGSWQRITWDEALDVIADHLSRIKARDGAQSVVLWEGAATVGFSGAGWDRRFLNLYGSPNWAFQDHLCYVPAVIAEKLTYGQVQVDGFEAEETRCVVLWGSDPATSHNPTQWHAVRRAQKRGASLIVVDPRRSEPAGRADLHLAIRPGTDTALALGIINLIITEGAYDADFVARWTVGFEALADRVRSFTAERVAVVTGLRAADIRRFAHLYASARPAHLDAGNALEHVTDSAQILRAIMILRAITGNLDVPGGNVLSRDLPLADLRLTERLPAGMRPLGADRYPLFSAFAGFVPGDALIDTMLTEQPYPLRAALVMGTNPMLSYPNTTRVRAALEKLQLLVVMDLFMTPTARMADIVLPAASAYERSDLITTAAPLGPHKPMWRLAWRQPVVDPGERRSDWWFLRNLSHRLGLGVHWPWANEEEAANAQLAPLGITVEDLKAHQGGLFYGPAPIPCGYEQDGFRTPTGKVELFSHVLESYGHDPLPHCEQAPKRNDRQAGGSGEYPLILNSSHRSAAYTLSRYRSLPSLQRYDPAPFAELHPDTARQFGIADGERMTVETALGAVVLRAHVTEDIVPGVVGVLHGWEEANANALLDDRKTDPLFATPALAAGSCRISGWQERANGAV